MLLRSGGVGAELGEEEGEGDVGACAGFFEEVCHCYAVLAG